MWKHKWKWHNRGNVWDNIATDWAGDDDWISKRKDKTSSADKTEFVTLVLNRMNLSTAHRKVTGKEKGKQAGSKPPRKLGPADATVYTREDGPTAQLCGDSEVVCKWINGKNSLGHVSGENWDDPRFAVVAPVQSPGTSGRPTLAATRYLPTKRGRVVVAAYHERFFGATSGMTQRRAGATSSRGWSEHLQVALGRQARYVGGASEDDQGHFTRGWSASEGEGRRGAGSAGLQAIDWWSPWSSRLSQQWTKTLWKNKGEGTKRKGQGDVGYHETLRGRVTAGCLPDDSFLGRASTRGKSHSVAAQVDCGYGRFALGEEARSSSTQVLPVSWRRSRLIGVLQMSGLRYRRFVVTGRSGVRLLAVVVWKHCLLRTSAEGSLDLSDRSARWRPGVSGEHGDESEGSKPVASLCLGLRSRDGARVTLSEYCDQFTTNMSRVSA